MAQIEMDLPLRGAAFQRVGGKVYFAFVADPRTVIGPREATAVDKERYADAWAAFQAAPRRAP